MDIDQITMVKNIIDMALEDPEQCSSVFKKLFIAKDMALKDPENRKMYSKNIMENNGFYPTVQIMQLFEEKIDKIDYAVNQIGAMFFQFIKRTDPELGKQIEDASVAAMAEAENQVTQAAEGIVGQN